VPALWYIHQLLLGPSQTHASSATVICRSTKAIFDSWLIDWVKWQLQRYEAKKNSCLVNCLLKHWALHNLYFHRLLVNPNIIFLLSHRYHCLDWPTVCENKGCAKLSVSEGNRNNKWSETLVRFHYRVLILMYTPVPYCFRSVSAKQLAAVAFIRNKKGNLRPNTSMGFQGWTICHSHIIVTQQTSRPVYHRPLVTFFAERATLLPLSNQTARHKRQL